MADSQARRRGAMTYSPKDGRSRDLNLPKGEGGSILLAMLLVLLAVTVLGVASINSSIVEMKISRAEREIRETFYLSEGAAMEGLQRLLEMAAVDRNEQFPCWYHGRKRLLADGVDFRDPTHWDVDGHGEDNGLPSALHPDAHVAAVEWRVATGGSLIQTGTRLYHNRVYGLCTRNGGNDVVEIGYDLRY